MGYLNKISLLLKRRLNFNITLRLSPNVTDYTSYKSLLYSNETPNYCTGQRWYLVSDHSPVTHNQKAAHTSDRKAN